MPNVTVILSSWELSFHHKKHKQGETVFGYVTTLEQLANTCKFETVDWIQD